MSRSPLKRSYRMICHPIHLKTKEAVEYVFSQKEGFYLLSSPPGTGKTTAIVEQIKKKSDKRICVAVNDHNAASTMKELLESQGDLDVFTYPKLTKENCRNYAMARRFQVAGLSIKSSLCPNCPFKKECERTGHYSAIKPHRDERIQILTKQRLARSGFPENCDITVIDEDAINTLCPTGQLSEKTLQETISLLEKIDERSHSLNDMASLIQAIINWESHPVVTFDPNKLPSDFNSFELSNKMAALIQSHGGLGENVIRVLNDILLPHEYRVITL